MNVDRRWPPLRGRLDVHGVFLEERWVPRPEARRRLIDLWEPGARLLETANADTVGWLLQWPERHSFRVAELPGEPLDRLDGRWVTVPELSASAAVDESRRAKGSVWLRPRDSRLEEVDLGTFVEVEVASWLDVADWSIIEVSSLGAPPPPPVAPKVEQATLEEHFGLSMQREPARELMRELAERQARQARWRNSWARFGQWLSGSGKAKHGPGYGTGPAASGRTLGVPPRPTGWQLGWSRVVAKLNLWSGFWRIFQQLQSKAMRELYRLLDEGNLEEALRRAPPLGKGDEPELPPSFGVPGRRDQLTIGGSAPAASAFYFGPAIHFDLRTRYLEAAERLERAGKLDSAAFVYAELLKEPSRAVELYEKHGKWRKAAEVAEVCGLEPYLIVRLYFLAGDLEKSLQIARLHGAFEPAVRELERRGEPRAAELRRLWASHLAETHRWLEAIDAIWPCEDRGDAEEWIELGLSPSALPAERARLLMFQMSLRGDQPGAASTMDAWRSLLAELEGRDAQRIATAIANHPEQHGGMLRHAARKLLAADDIAGDVVDRVVRMSGDAAFRSEVQQLPKLVKSQLPEKRSALRLEIVAGDRGTRAIFDAVPLPNGRVLVALGEEGVLELDRWGKPRRHYDEPAHQLVVADHGRSAILVAPRDSIQRLGRLDLDRGRAERWTDAELDILADSYDGDRLYATHQDVLWVIDARAEDWRALWRVPGLPQPPWKLARDRERCALVTGVPAEVWCWDASMTLRSRREVAEEVLDSIFLQADGTVGWIGPGEIPSQGILRVSKEGDHVNRMVLANVTDATRISRLGNAWFRTDANSWQSFTAADTQVILHGSQALQSRSFGREPETARIALWDELGRLVVLGGAGKLCELDVRL